MKKYFLFYIATGLIAPVWYHTISETPLNITLAIIAACSAVAVLGIGKIAHLPYLLPANIILLAITALMVQNGVMAVLFSVISAICLTLIQIAVAKEKGTSENNFSKLNFYAQIAFAVSVLAAGLITPYVQLIAAIILCVFSILTLKKAL